MSYSIGIPVDNLNLLRMVVLGTNPPTVQEFVELLGNIEATDVQIKEFFVQLLQEADGRRIVDTDHVSVSAGPMGRFVDIGEIDYNIIFLKRPTNLAGNQVQGSTGAGVTNPSGKNTAFGPDESSRDVITRAAKEITDLLIADGLKHYGESMRRIRTVLRAGVPVWYPSELSLGNISL